MQIKVKRDLEEYKNISFADVLHRIDSPLSTRIYHYHDAFEIYLSLTDHLQMMVGGKAYPPGKGHLYVFNNLDIHKPDLQPGKIYDRYMIHFNPEYIQCLCTSETNLLDCFVNRGDDFSHCIVLTEEQVNMLVPLFDKIAEYVEQSNKNIYAADVRAKLSLAEILLNINSLYKTCRTADSITFNKEYERINAVLDYVNKNINRDISVSDISHDLYISKRHLEACFKRATGCTIKEYIMNQKIETAKQLLKQNLRVSEVSEMVGFKSVTHFIRSFNARVGISPKQFTKTKI